LDGDCRVASAPRNDDEQGLLFSSQPESALSNRAAKRWLRRLAAPGPDNIAIVGAVRGVAETDAAASRALLQKDALPAMR